MILRRAAVIASLAACGAPARPPSHVEVDVVQAKPATPVTSVAPAPSEPTKDHHAIAAAVAHAYAILVEDSIVPADPKAVREAALIALGFAGSGASLRPWTGEVAKDGENLRDALLAMAARGKLPGDATLRAVHAMAAAVEDTNTFAVSPAAKQGLFALIGGGPVVQVGMIYNRGDDGRWRASHVFAGGAAAAAGIVAGDVIVALGGVPVRRGFLDSLPLLGAAPGTTVAITIERAGKPQQLALELRPLAPPVLDWKLLPGGIGYVRLWTCTQAADTARDAGALLANALAELDRKKAKKLVLDLRGNAGGYPFDVASLLIEADPLLVAVGQDGASQPVPRTRPAWKIRRAHVVVLVDEQTATGAEMLAFALREHLGARVVGRTTAGTLTFPNTEKIAADVALSYPISRVVGPRTKTASEGNHVEPDLVVANPTPDDHAAGRDPQLAAALGELASR